MNNSFKSIKKIKKYKIYLFFRIYDYITFCFKDPNN